MKKTSAGQRVMGGGAGQTELGEKFSRFHSTASPAPWLSAHWLISLKPVTNAAAAARKDGDSLGWPLAPSRSRSRGGYRPSVCTHTPASSPPDRQPAGGQWAGLTASPKNEGVLEIIIWEACRHGMEEKRQGSLGYTCETAPLRPLWEPRSQVFGNIFSSAARSSLLQPVHPEFLWVMLVSCPFP